ncbi:MAG TPA: hypothetical protein VME22_22655 [Solirubrobacteraceae bacterium]|nr:hypothetical protein [Solirubrobacteraceae bacterium]
MGDPGDAHIADLMERALGLAEETLEQIARIAVEQIRRGVESSNHVEAAERDLRSALRQLVLAKREWRTVPAPARTLDEAPESLAQVTTNSSRP